MAIGVVFLHHSFPGRTHSVQIRTVGDLKVGVVAGQHLVLFVDGCPCPRVPIRRTVTNWIVTNGRQRRAVSQMGAGQMEQPAEEISRHELDVISTRIRDTCGRAEYTCPPDQGPDDRHTLTAKEP